MRGALTATAVLLCATASAMAQDGPAEDPERAAREDALFGGDEQNERAEREDALFGRPAATTDGFGLREDELDIADRAEDKNDPLQIGGMLYLRLDWNTLEDGDPATFPLSSPSLLDLYLDVRPSDRVRAYTRGRVAHDFSAREESTATYGEPQEKTRAVLDQLWIKFDLDRRVFFTVGQQPIRWGHSRFWNPTDFLNRRFKDPLAVFDERLGVALIKLHIPVESLGWNFYAIANLDEAEAPDQIGAAVRAEILLGTMEIAASFAARRDEPYRLGLSFSAGFWLIDAWAEGAMLYGVQTPHYEGVFDPNSWTMEPATWEHPTARDISTQWWPRASTGFEVSIPIADEDALYVGVEYAFNGLGYDDASLYPWLAIQGDLTPLYTGKHYGAAYARLPAPGRWDDVTFTLSQLANLSDQSYILRFDTRLRVLTYLDLNFYAQVHYGEVGELRYREDMAPNPGFAGMLGGLSEADAAALEKQLGAPVDTMQRIAEEGLGIPAPLVDVGVGLRLRL